MEVSGDARRLRLDRHNRGGLVGVRPRNELFALSTCVELAGLKLCMNGAIVTKRRIMRSARNSLFLGLTPRMG